MKELRVLRMAIRVDVKRWGGPQGDAGCRTDKDPHHLVSEHEGKLHTAVSLPCGRFSSV